MRLGSSFGVLFYFIALMLLTNKISGQERYIQGIDRKIYFKEVNRILSHEHIVTNFVGAQLVKVPERKDSAIGVILPFLLQLKESGVNVLFECTPSYIGKDVRLLVQLSNASGIQMVTNTGLYAAADKKYLPPYFYTSSYKDLAQGWIADFRNGIDGTGVKPGFIKIGVGSGEIDAEETKLLMAAIETSKNTGLSIAVHTDDFHAAKSEYALVKRNGFPPSKLIWVHAQNASNKQRKNLAKKGVWISLDSVTPDDMEQYVEAILYFRKHKLLHRLLISHDDGWAVNDNGSYTRLTLFNQKIIPYQTISQKLVQQLVKHGMTGKEIETLLRENPFNCFAID